MISEPSSSLKVDTDYILVYIEADEYIRKHRFLEKKEVDVNVFNNLDKLQKTKYLSTIDQKYTIFNNGSLNDLKDSFNKVYEELDNE